MEVLTSPRLTVTFVELGSTAIDRGTKGVVGIILRDAAGAAPVALTKASQIPENWSTENRAYVERAFLGHTQPPKKVIVYTESAEDGAGTLKDALAYMAGQDIDYLVGPVDCTEAEAEAIAAWVREQREDMRAKCKAVLPQYAADYWPIVNFAGSDMTDGTTSYGSAAYCSRIAGLLAGTPFARSATYAPLAELTGVKALSRDERDEAVAAGQLIAVWDGKKVKLDRAVTSLTTTDESAGIGGSYKKIKLVELMDLIRTDLVIAIEDKYIGQYANSYANKQLLIAAIRGYFQELRKDDLVQVGYAVDIDVDAQEKWLRDQGADTSEMTEQEIREANTGTHVFILVICKLLDAIEDVAIAVTI